MINKLFGLMAVVALVFGLVHSAQAIIIDDFSDGAIATLTAPPSTQTDQAGLAGVIATGDRRTLMSQQGGTGSVHLNVNNAVPGDAVLTVDTGTVGGWFFIYGHNSPFDLDITGGGVSTHFEVQFASADAGTLSAIVFDLDGDAESHNTPFAALPSGGTVSIPFSLFVDPDVDLTHVKEVILTIGGGGNYQIQSFSTQPVALPEPATFGLLAVGLAALVACRRRLRA